MVKEDAHLCGSLSDHQDIISDRGSPSVSNHPHVIPRSPRTPNRYTRNFGRTSLAIRILRVAKGVLDLGLASISAAGEEIVAHGNSDLANDVDEVVVEDHVGPAFATIDGKAFTSLAALCLAK